MPAFPTAGRLLVIALGIVLVQSPAAGAYVSPATICQAALVRGSQKVVATRTKALQRCEASVVAGLPGYSSPPGGRCADAAGKTAAAIAKAEAKFKRLIDARCGGSDKTCGTGLEPSMNQLDFYGACPGFARRGCTNDLDHCGGVVSDGCGVTDCLLCIDDGAVDEAINLYGDHFATAEFGTGTATNRCQAALEAEPAKFLTVTSKARAKCWDAVVKGKPGFTSPCPYGDASNKTQAAIAKAQVDMITNLCRACGGPDEACDVQIYALPGSGNADDLTPAEIGFMQACPGTACGNRGYIDGLPKVVDSLRELILCVDCMTTFTADCADVAAVPNLEPYHFQCRDCLDPAPSGTCPTTVEIAVDAEKSDLDLGWTGVGHDLRLPTGDLVTLGLSNCQFASQPCATCTVTGPVASGVSLDKRRCSDAPWVHCSADGDCTTAGAAGPCTFFIGAPMPAVTGGVPICLVNEVADPVTGTLNVTAGKADMTLPIRWRLHATGTPASPCPLCLAGPCAGGHCCSAGPRAGEACTVDGEDRSSGSFSLDCPPDAGSEAGVLRTRVPLATDDYRQLHLSAANPECRASGWESRRCYCDTCNNADADACMSDADCPESPPGTPGICGGPRCLGGANAGTPCSGSGDCDSGDCGVPGAPTAANACTDGFCFDGSLNGSDHGWCVNGPFEGVCSLDTFRSCAIDTDCLPPSDGGNCPFCRAHQRCSLSSGEHCFPDNGVIGRHCFGRTNNVEPCITYDDCPAQNETNVECGGGTSVVEGALSATCADHAEPTLGGFFCVPPTTSGAVNQALGLPGLGRARLSVALKFKP